MATGQEAIDLLRSIDATLKALVTFMRANAPKEVASDSDLDSAYGDPIVRAKDPRDWSHESQIGKPFSECPPEYLDLVAARLDFFADKAEAEGTLTTSGKPVAPYNRRDAARARGWARRLRAGWTPVSDPRGTPRDNGTAQMPQADEIFGQQSTSGFPSDDEIPFAFFIGMVLPAAFAVHAAFSVFS